MNGDTRTATEVFAELYEQSLPKVFSYISYRVNNTYLAEDLTSEVFEKALTKFGSYRSDRASFPTWILSIARHTLIDHFRRMAREQKALMRTTEMASNHTNSENEATGIEERQTLRDCLSRLSPREQEIISLKFAAELTNGQVAGMLNLSESNVGTILYRAVCKLRDCFKEWNHGQGC